MAYKSFCDLCGTEITDYSTIQLTYLRTIPSNNSRYYIVCAKDELIVLDFLEELKEKHERGVDV